MPETENAQMCHETTTRIYRISIPDKQQPKFNLRLLIFGIKADSLSQSRVRASGGEENHALGTVWIKFFTPVKAF